MIEPKSMSEIIMYSTARIRASLPDARVSTGTGFFFHIPVEGEGVTAPVIITNKHVIDHAVNIEFVIHTVSDKSKKVPDGRATINSVRSDWVDHPNPKIDLCCAPVGGVFNQLSPPPFSAHSIQDSFPLQSN
ncbi:MAG TPA: hypothetical protein VJL90_00850 [Pseudorhodoplanes sp.]|nr:hypothetical protein [Pseudorhodoplanes sp.]